MNEEQDSELSIDGYADSKLSIDTKHAGLFLSLGAVLVIALAVVIAADLLARSIAH